MENISALEAARSLLDHCLNRRPWGEALLDQLCQDDSSHLLFRVVAEGLADRFDPALCDAYADVFSEVAARAISELHAPHLRERYERIRKPRCFAGDSSAVENVFVLSRVTLGADVAVTSVLMDAARRRFTKAALFLVGSRKAWELFAADPSIRHLSVQYGRGASLAERVAVWPELRALLCQPRSIVIDPDSRLTQLGLLPVCPEEDYYFFESRAYGGDDGEPLSKLASRWASETFGVTGAKPFVALPPAEGRAPDITVSIGVGENPAKRIADPFERNLLHLLAGRGSVLIDKGAGGEEAERVERAIRGRGGAVRTWPGSFAGFAAHIAHSKLYVGYDSAGGHVAAACGVPMVSVFAGAISERMFARWRPSGDGPVRVIRADSSPPDMVWMETEKVLSAS